MSLWQLMVLAMIQGAAELLPVSSSAHVILAEKLMGIDPSTPEMTFFLVMLHTGTMGAVLVRFWPRWRSLTAGFLKMAVLATGVTGVLGLGLKKFIEKVILEGWLGESHGEVESLFKSLPLMSGSLLGVGLLIIYAGLREQKSAQESISQGSSLRIGLVQGLCLPFRGFSRSGATISMAMLSGVAREAAEDFSFALAVLLTPPVLLLQLLRLSHAVDASQVSVSWTQTLAFGALGMMLSFAAGFMALKWLSSWLGSGKWKYFGFYCVGLSFLVFSLSQFGF